MEVYAGGSLPFATFQCEALSDLSGRRDAGIIVPSTRSAFIIKPTGGGRETLPYAIVSSFKENATKRKVT